MSSNEPRAVPLSSHRMTAWCGRSGQSYAFWAYGIDEPLPAAPGVYAYAAPVATPESWRVVYLGETECFGEGVAKNDDSRAAAESLGATHVLLHCQGGSGAERLEAERDLTAQLAPELNSGAQGTDTVARLAALAAVG